MNGATCSTRNKDADTLAPKTCSGPDGPGQVEGSPVADGQILERTAVAAPVEIVVVGRATRIRLQ